MGCKLPVWAELLNALCEHCQGSVCDAAALTAGIHAVESAEQEKTCTRGRLAAAMLFAMHHWEVRWSGRTFL